MFLSIEVARMIKEGKMPFFTIVSSQPNGEPFCVTVKRGDDNYKSLCDALLENSEDKTNTFIPRNNFEQTAESLMKVTVKAFKEDFYKFDIPRFRSKEKGTKFIWQVRKHGTFLCFEDDLTNCKEYFASCCYVFNDESVFYVGKVEKFATFRIIHDEPGDPAWKYVRDIALFEKWDSIY